MFVKQVCMLFVLFVASTSYGNIVIDFEPLPGMLNSPGLVPSASQLSNQYLTTDGVVFSSTRSYVAVVNLGPLRAAAVPEPSSATMAVLVVLSFLHRRRYVI